MNSNWPRHASMDEWPTQEEVLRSVRKTQRRQFWFEVIGCILVAVAVVAVVVSLKVYLVG